MKANWIKKITAACFVLLVACEESGVRPVLPDDSLFIAPVLNNAATAPAAEFLPENEADEYEVFEWEVADYGIDASIMYTLEIATDEDFTDPEAVAEVQGNGDGETRSVSVSVKDFNDAMLGLGLPGFQESTVFVRVKSELNGVENDPLGSNSVSRIAKTYQTSECGDYCTIGLIGDATTGSGAGWNNDIDLRLLDLTKVDKHVWTTTVYLYGGFGAKFRAQDDWATNWGSLGFPSGTGTQNGDNIPIPTDGYYKVVFDDESGDYSFTAVTATYTSVGLIGDGVGGWGDADEIFLTQDPNDEHLWTGTVDFSAADVKFRANAAWTTNWGNTTYPSGIGAGNGPNIPVPTAGTYFVWFNDASGEYLFGPVANATPYATVGLVGPANGLANPWDNDKDLIKDPSNPFKWSMVFTLAGGEGKFRADDAWTVNWGASTFPGGKGTQNGPNIPTADGQYAISFNSLTGEYYFLR